MQNVSQLQPPPPSQARSVSKEASEKEADFLVLRLLNKRNRVRLSPESFPLDAIPGQGRLFVVANLKGWFTSVVRHSGSQYALACSPLSDLHISFASPSEGGHVALEPKRILPLQGVPQTLVFANHESCLLVAFADGSICVYDTQALLTPGSGNQQPQHVFPPSAGSVIRHMSSNPGDIAELVAVLREVGGSALPVEIFDVQKMQSVGGWRGGDTPGSRPSTLSWSPKGKQLAVGLQSGDIITFSPSATSSPKSHVPPPPAVSGQSVIATTWLSNTEFHTVYAAPGPLAPDVEQNHFIVTLDSKTNTVGDVKLNTPCLPYPGLRPPALFPVVLRNWASAKYLVFSGDSASSDIGLIGSVNDSSSQDAWCNLSLEETSTPTVPLDKDMNDTVLLGLELDLTWTQPYQYTGASGEESEVPPPPVMYAYASDGTLTGWYIVHTAGMAYPGMVTTSATTTSQATITSASPPAQSAFGQPSAFSSTSVAAAFKPVPSPFVQPSPSSGSVFGTSGTSSFSQPSFGFGAGPSSASAPQPSSTVDEDAMAADGDGDTTANQGFGGLSLGSSSMSDKPSGGGTNSMFGSSGVMPSTSTGTTTGSAFGSSSFGSGPIKPATGFGAFASNGPSAFGVPAAGGTQGQDAKQPSAFGQPSTFGQSAFGQPASSSALGQPSGFGKPASAQPAFGQTSFGSASAASATSSASAPAFGQSSFGQPTSGTPAFGQSSFGKPSPAFGQTSFLGGSGFASAMAAPAPVPPAKASSGGGFSAFAQAAPTSFGALAPKDANAKPVWASAGADETRRDPGWLSAPFGEPSPITKPPTSAFSVPSASSTPAPLASSVSPPTSQTPTSPVANPKPAPASPAPSSGPEASSPNASPSASASKASASPFTSSTPGPTGGAFGGLVSTPSGFGKLEAGFGAFGSSAAPSSSPFFQPPKPSGVSAFGQPVSAFGGTTTPASTPPKEATSKPAFGQPSALGTAKSVFGSPSLGPTPPVAPAAPTTGGFAAFSGAASPFAATTSTSSSFGDLLKKDGTGSKAPTSVFSKPPATITPPEAQKKEETEKPASVFSVFSKDLGPSAAADTSKGKGRENPLSDKPVSVFSTLKKDSSPGSPQRSPKTGSPKAGSPKGKRPLRPSIATPPGSPLAVETDDDSEEEYVDEEQVEGEYDEDARSFLSETFSDDSGGEQVAVVLAEDETDSEPPSPTQSAGSSTASPPPQLQVTLPESTPEPRKPVFSAPPSPAIETASLDKGKGVPAREGSTTPPGSPATSPSTLTSASASSANAVSSLAPSPVISSFGVGARPSTRPARSSPLASTPINGDDDDGSPSKAKSAPPGTTSITMDANGEAAKSRSKTPPLLSAFDKAPPPASAPFSLKPPAASPAPFSLPKPPVPGPITATSSNSPAMTTSTAPPGQSGGLFGKPSVPPTSTAQPAAPLFPPPPSTASLFGPKTVPSSSTPTGSQPRTPLFMPPPATMTPPVKGNLLGAKPAPSSGMPAARPAVPPQAALAEGMQTECLYLFAVLGKEIEALRTMAQDASRKREAMAKAAVAIRSRRDLAEPAKWVIGDVAQFGQIVKSVETDIKAFELQKAARVEAIQELEGSMLKASMRKEEVVRFSKASKDAEFAKMLKIRTLGPEYLETQSQLRRDIRVSRDRLQLLEEHIQSSKKKLSQIKKGKPSIKPPSLDTIHRIYRNIDTSIEQQEDGIAELTARAAKLKLDARQSTPSRDKRLPDKTLRPLALTPSVAMTTAAALNAEMSANKLKRALLTTRKEPMLNKSAMSAEPLSRAKQTPIKAVKVEPMSPDLFSESSWTISAGADDSFEEDHHSGPTSGSRTRSGKSKYHAPPVHLKKTPTASPSPPPPNFNWGPLPGITPMKTLSSDVRQNSPLVAPITPPSLSSSWVTEGFGVKK